MFKIGEYIKFLSSSKKYSEFCYQDVECKQKFIQELRIKKLKNILF